MTATTGSRAPVPENAFDSGFLAGLRDRDDPPEALAAECGGAWTLRSWEESEFGLFRSWEEPLADLPRASFLDETAAHLAAAVLPSLGNEPIYRFEGGPDDRGRFAIRRRGDYCGQMMLFDESWLAAMNLAAELARSPVALAHLLEAAGPTAVELAGRCLCRAVGKAKEGPSSRPEPQRTAGFRAEP